MGRGTPCIDPRGIIVIGQHLSSAVPNTQTRAYLIGHVCIGGYSYGRITQYTRYCGVSCAELLHACHHIAGINIKDARYLAVTARDRQYQCLTRTGEIVVLVLNNNGMPPPCFH